MVKTSKHSPQQWRRGVLSPRVCYQKAWVSKSLSALLALSRSNRERSPACAAEWRTKSPTSGTRLLWWTSHWSNAETAGCVTSIIGTAVSRKRREWHCGRTEHWEIPTEPLALCKWVDGSAILVPAGLSEWWWMPGAWGEYLHTTR